MTVEIGVLAPSTLRREISWVSLENPALSPLICGVVREVGRLGLRLGSLSHIITCGSDRLTCGC